MSPDPSIPSLARDLVRIHKAISRGLSVSVTRASQFIKEGIPDAGLSEGYLRYVKALAIVLGAHHLSEDQIAFPAFKIKLPAAPYERLAADHQTIESSLAQINQALRGMGQEEAAAPLGAVVASLEKVSTVWAPHIQLEETHFSQEAIARVMSSDDQAQIGASMRKHSQEHAVPPYLALPFVLYNLGPEDRASMAEALPRQVTEELVPKVWKAQWEPMQPFLLD